MLNSDPLTTIKASKNSPDSSNPPKNAPEVKFLVLNYSHRRCKRKFRIKHNQVLVNRLQAVVEAKGGPTKY